MPIFVPVQDAEPPPPPPPPGRVSPAWHHSYQLIGVDGSVWDLVAGPVYILDGVDGLEAPEPEHRFSDGITHDGSVWRGMRYPRQEWSLPLEVDGRLLSPDDWRDLEHRFWRALNPRLGEAQLVVTSPAGDRRVKRFRAAGLSQTAISLDPGMGGDNVYALSVVSADPFWHGTSYRAEYGVETDPVPLFPGPPFGIGDSGAFGDGTVVNDGTEPAWWRMTFSGPLTTASVTLGDAELDLAEPVGNGHSRTVETAPAGRYIRDDFGNLRWSAFSTRRFAAIPPGDQVPLTIVAVDAVAGQTSILLEFETLYLRPFS